MTQLEPSKESGRSIYYKHERKKRGLAPHASARKGGGKSLSAKEIVIICLVVSIIVPTFLIKEGVIRYEDISHFIMGKPLPSLSPAELQQSLVSMSIDDAYQRLNGKNLPYNAINTLSVDENRYLSSVFDLIDIGVMERAKTLLWHKHYSPEVPRDYQHTTLIRSLHVITPPPRFKRFHTLLVHGLKKQLEFFRWWHNNPTETFNKRQPHVMPSHNDIYAAYGELLKHIKGNKPAEQVAYQHLYTLCLD
jgi:hypothetical protein